MSNRSPLPIHYSIPRLQISRRVGQLRRAAWVFLVVAAATGFAALALLWFVGIDEAIEREPTLSVFSFVAGLLAAIFGLASMTAWIASGSG
jgi:hypothetical protein